MKEKYIFFTLSIIAVVLLIGAGLSKENGGEISPKERLLERKISRVAQRRIVSSPQVNIEKVQDLVAFSNYERILKRSPFFKVQLKQANPGRARARVISVDLGTPFFSYKGKIMAGNRLVVIIEQKRSGEVFMVSKGENVDGYKVLDILDTEVILSKKGEENIILKTIE